MKDRILQDGKTYRLSGGRYVPETTAFGNPRVRLDMWGKPVIETDAFGNQVVERDMMGNPRIPVEYGNIGDLRRPRSPSTPSGGGGGLGVLVAMMPFILLAGGLYSVFATVAGGVALAVIAGGLAVTLVVATIADGAGGNGLSNGMQVPFYVLSVGWAAGAVAFWVQFFRAMNFDVSNTNYLTPESLVSAVLPKVAMAALAGIALASLFAWAFRADMRAVRESSPRRTNRECVGDMLGASLAPPVLAVPVSLVWCLVVATAVSAFTDLTWGEVVDMQATAMAVVFVALGVTIVASRSLEMVRGGR